MGERECQRHHTFVRPILIVPEKTALENTTCSLLFCSFSAPKKAPCGERAREERFVNGKFVKLSLVLLSRTQRRSPFFALFSRQKEEARSFLSSFAPQGALFLEKRKKEDSFFSFLRVLGAHKNRPDEREHRTAVMKNSCLSGRSWKNKSPAGWDVISLIITSSMQVHAKKRSRTTIYH